MKTGQTCRFYFQVQKSSKTRPLKPTSTVQLVPGRPIHQETTVDGKNPANQLRLVVEIRLFTGFWEHPRWLFGISEPSTVVFQGAFAVRFRDVSAKPDLGGVNLPDLGGFQPLDTQCMIYVPTMNG